MRKFLRLKQQAKFKTIYRNIFINLFVFKLRTNITFKNVSLKGLKRKQSFETRNHASVLLICRGK